MKPGTQTQLPIRPTPTLHGKKANTDFAGLTATRPLRRDSDAVIGTYCVPLPELSSFSDSPPLKPRVGAVQMGGGLREGGNSLRCQRQMAATDRRVAAPHLDKRHAAGVGAGLLAGNWGATTARSPPRLHRPAPKRARRDPPKLHPRTCSRRAPRRHLVSAYLLSAHRHPACATSAGREGAGVPHLPRPRGPQGRAWHARVAVAGRAGEAGAARG